jgi:kynureninase
MMSSAELDARDPLQRFAGEFQLPAGVIYLDGNSLGLLSRRAEERLARVVNQWRSLGIDGWTRAEPPWLDLPGLAAAGVAPIVGAALRDVGIGGQTTPNLHQLLATLFDSTASARVIVADALNFASDTYALRSHLRLRGLDPARHLRLIPSRDGRILRVDDILAAFTPDVQLVLLPAVLFTSGQLLDVATITRKAKAAGITIGWDLSHSIGAVPHELARDGADFAVWSHYKWLNAGPGAVGGFFLHPRHDGRPPGLAGWWGVRPERRFAMAPEHEPAAGAAGLQIGTPHILSLAPLLGSLEIMAEAGGIAALRAKSLAQTDLLLARIDRELAGHGFTVVTPRGQAVRGGHIAVAHPDAWRLCQALKAAGVVPDFRGPDLIRLAPSPLYTSFTDCEEAITRLRRIVETGAHLSLPQAPALVP